MTEANAEGSVLAGNPEAATGAPAAQSAIPPQTVNDVPKSGDGFDWQGALGDDFEAYKGTIEAKGFTKPSDVLKSYNNLEKHIGGEPLSLPGEDATADEHAEFWRKNMGTPEKAEGYDFKIPEGMENYSQDKADWFRQVAHDANMPADMAQKIHDKFIENSVNDVSNWGEIKAGIEKQDGEALRESWGNDFDKNAQLAHRGMREHLSEDEAKRLVDYGLGNMPGLTEAFKILGEGLAEGEFKDGDGGGNSFATSKEGAIAQIESLKLDSGFMSAIQDKQNAGHKAAAEKWRKLHETAYPGVAS